MGIAQWESHGNGNWLQNWEWEWEGMGIDHVGMGGNGNVKSHSNVDQNISVTVLDRKKVSTEHLQETTCCDSNGHVIDHVT